jgi:hypothetical protein
MHMLIMVLVYAKDEKGALDEAHEVVHEKMGYTHLGGPFDYYVDFTETPRKEPGVIAEEMAATVLNNSGCSVLARFGRSRYGPIPPVLQVSTARFPINDKRGLEMLNAAMENNRNKFKENMAHIRYHIEKYTDDQLFDEIDDNGIEIEGLTTNPAWFRDFCEYASGSSKGPVECLYDFKGRTISSPKILHRILNDSDSNQWYMDESDGQDPNWGHHIWNQPLWVVPFDVHF